MGDMFEPKKPCFVLFRLDSSGSDGAEWVLVSYVPDGSPVCPIPLALAHTPIVTITNQKKKKKGP